jgi:hypothetical protein
MGLNVNSPIDFGILSNNGAVEKLKTAAEHEVTALSFDT